MEGTSMPTWERLHELRKGLFSALKLSSLLHTGQILELKWALYQLRGEVSTLAAASHGCKKNCMGIRWRPQGLWMPSLQGYSSPFEDLHVCQWSPRLFKIPLQAQLVYPMREHKRECDLVLTKCPQGSTEDIKVWTKKLFRFWEYRICPVHMDKMGHKYLTLWQINVPRVMILSQNLGYLFDNGTFIWQWGTFIWQGGTFIWQEGTFILRRVTILLPIIRGTKFWSCVRTLKRVTCSASGLVHKIKRGRYLQQLKLC